MSWMEHWFESIRKGDIEQVRTMMSEFARSTDEGGASGLMYAAEFGYHDIVDLLCDAEHNMRDSRGDYASQYAFRSGNIAILDYLLPYESNEEILREISASVEDVKMVRQESRYAAYELSIYKLELLLDERTRMYENASKPQESRNSTPDDVVKKLIEERERLNSKITELEEFIAEQGTTIDEEEAACKKLQTENEKLEFNLEQLQKEKSSFMITHNLAVTQIATLEAENKRLRSDVVGLQTRLVTQESHQAALRAEEATRITVEESTDKKAEPLCEVSNENSVYRQLLLLQLEAHAKEYSSLVKLCNQIREETDVADFLEVGDTDEMNWEVSSVRSSLLTICICLLLAIAIIIMGYLSHYQ